MKFFLIDGSGFLYRAYYALPPLNDKDGRNVNVVFGFFRMLLKIFQEKPDYLVITRDSPVKTVRHEAYPEYKATRKKMEDDFKQQIPLTKEIVQELDIPNITVDGYEADDIIATFVDKYKKNSDLKIGIYSADKDLKQLLAPNVYIIDPIRDVITNQENFQKEFGFESKYMLDYLALIGDSSDNIKGVPGIGPKTASELIIKYQTLENIYDHIDEITGSVKQKLLEGKESAFQSKQLIQLRIISELKLIDREKFKLTPDFEHYKNVLVHNHNFHSIEKLINELKKKYETPEQLSLF